MTRVNSSKYRGVTRYARTGKWQAQLTMYLGYYHTAEEAALAYNAKALELYGNDAILNDVQRPARDKSTEPASGDDT